MKKFLAAVVFGLMAVAAQAEATFDQVQTLIQQHNYSAAEKGLEEIIRNHPKSAKAFYAMAQAQAGLGNQEKARKALDIATGLNPTLDFVPESSVRNLKEAITPQIGLIEPVEESHFWRNTIMALILASAIGFAFMMYIRKENEKADAKEAEEYRKHEEAMEQLRKTMAKSREDDLKASKTASTYVPPAPRPAYRGTTQTVAPAPVSSTPTHTTTVVNNSSNDLLTGVILGNMMGSSHHDTTRVVEREIVREVEVPAKAPKSSWDDIGSTPSKSSSWDDTPSKPSRSSSWDDDSSSKKSSSWDSSSSSSSSSSWDSGSSSSDSSSSSSSSWD
jgi:tetratricopeptide (TPR) repeat protein